MISLRKLVYPDRYSQKANLWIIDIENVTAEDLQKLQPVLKKWQKKGGMLLALSSGSKLSDAFCKWLPEDVKLTDRRASALETNKNTAWEATLNSRPLFR